MYGDKRGWDRDENHALTEGNMATHNRQLSIGSLPAIVHSGQRYDCGVCLVQRIQAYVEYEVVSGICGDAELNERECPQPRHNEHLEREGGTGRGRRRSKPRRENGKGEAGCGEHGADGDDVPQILNRSDAAGGLTLLVQRCPKRPYEGLQGANTTTTNDSMISDHEGQRNPHADRLPNVVGLHWT